MQYWKTLTITITLLGFRTSHAIDKSINNKILHVKAKLQMHGVEDLDT